MGPGWWTVVRMEVRCSEPLTVLCSGCCRTPPSPLQHVGSQLRLCLATALGQRELPCPRLDPSQAGLHPVTGQRGGQFLASSQNSLKGQPNSRALCAIGQSLCHSSIISSAQPCFPFSLSPSLTGYFPVNSLYAKLSLKLFAMD